MHRERIVRGLLLGLLVTSGWVGGARANEPEGALTGPMPLVNELEVEIHGLRAPIDPNQMGLLFYHVSRLEDVQERERLQQLLNDRMNELMAVPSSLGAEPTDEQLRARIASINLDETASAAQLQAKEELVTAILAIQDTERRERLLKELEWRELGEKTAIYSPQTSPTP